jgi:hypothetical protein
MHIHHTCSQTKVLTDAAAHFEHGVLFKCDVGAKTEERSRIECLV